MESKIKLPHLSDSQAVEVERRARIRGVDIDQCPTCKSVLDEFNERDSGTYRFDGEEYVCDCDTQLLLRKHYLLANIPDQYMSLDWNRDYNGPDEIKENVQSYLDSWEEFKHYGMGIEFGGTSLGVGKTFAATHIGKELIKRREDVYFVEFDEVLAALKNEDSDLERRLRETNVVILDEIRPPTTDKQKAYFAARFESIIRHRTNWNGVTILTTNLSEQEIEQHYPRPYSLLSAKQIRVDLSGDDARRNIGHIILERIANKERAPIT